MASGTGEARHPGIPQAGIGDSPRSCGPALLAASEIWLLKHVPYKLLSKPGACLRGFAQQIRNDRRAFSFEG